MGVGCYVAKDVKKYVYKEEDGIGGAEKYRGNGEMYKRQVYVWVCVCVCIYMCVCVYIYIYVCVCVCV